MKRTKRRTIRTSVCFFLINVALIGQTISPFNKRAIQDTSANYSFIVSGHFYGSTYNASTFPASSIQANLDALNALQPAFLMSLGDMFIDVNEQYVKNYQKSLFNKLQMPLFNAVGNHDVSNGNIYEKFFGKEFFAFTKGTEQYIVLNTEIDDGSIKNEQLVFLKEQLNSSSSNTIKNIFIFTHRPIWAERIDKYKKLFLGNTRTVVGTNNFTEDIKPLLTALSGKKKIYWLSGSMGGGPASFFYDREEETQVTFMQTAIRDQQHDAALQVKITNGEVSFLGISFTEQVLNKIEDYNITYWQRTQPPEDKFNYRLLPYLTMQLLTHADFWIGAFVSAILILLIFFFRKKRK